MALVLTALLNGLAVVPLVVKPLPGQELPGLPPWRTLWAPWMVGGIGALTAKPWPEGAVLWSGLTRLILAGFVLAAVWPRSRLLGEATRTDPRSKTRVSFPECE